MSKRGLWILLVLHATVFGSVSCDSPKSPVADPPAALRLLTYNVLADPVESDHRTRALLEIMTDADADVIALQEVAPWFAQSLLAHPSIRRDYHYTKLKGHLLAPGGQLILSRYPITDAEWRVMPGRQRRTVLVAHIKVGGRSMKIATTHMESFLEDGLTRARQLDAIFKLLGDDGEAVLLGDLNFGDGEQPETMHLDGTYTDMWLKLHPGQAGFTWDIHRNPLAGVNSFPTETSRRLDRILIRSTQWRPVSMRIIGEMRQ